MKQSNQSRGSRETQGAQQVVTGLQDRLQAVMPRFRELLNQPGAAEVRSELTQGLLERSAARAVRLVFNQSQAPVQVQQRSGNRPQGILAPSAADSSQSSIRKQAVMAPGTLASVQSGSRMQGASPIGGVPSVQAGSRQAGVVSTGAVSTAQSGNRMEGRLPVGAALSVQYGNSKQQAASATGAAVSSVQDRRRQQAAMPEGDASARQAWKQQSGSQQM